MFKHKTNTLLFSGKYGFNMLPSSLLSHYIVSCPCRTRRFLEAVATTRTTTTLAIQNRANFLPFSPSGVVSDALSINLLHWSTLRFTAAIASGFCTILAMRVLASITSSNYVGRIPACPCAIKSCLPRVYP